MERKINETFQDHGRTLKVVQNEGEGHFRGRFCCHCNKNCYYYHHGSCNGRLQDTGDCQPRWREDHTPVYFEPIDE